MNRSPSFVVAPFLWTVDLLLYQLAIGGLPETATEEILIQTYLKINLLMVAWVKRPPLMVV